MPRTKEEVLADFSKLADELIALGREEMRHIIMMTATGITTGPPTVSQPTLREIPRPSPQKIGAQSRAPHGAIKTAIAETIRAHPHGISRGGMVKYAKEKLNVTVKDGSLKNALRILKGEHAIRNREGKWFPVGASSHGKPGGSSPGPGDVDLN